MAPMREVSPWRVLLPVSLGTGLSLFGDSSLYTVLPTHTAEAGIAIGALGLLLSVNRLIRLALNSPIGLIYERLPRRKLFIPALVLGALSTALYALTQGFWPLLFGRLLWGLAWVGIWVGGNTIILDITEEDDRGRWIGRYQFSFFLGAASGALGGGLLTDWLGYHGAMGVGAGLTLFGALVAWLALPETQARQQTIPSGSQNTQSAAPGPRNRLPRAELLVAIVMLGVTRLTMAGMLSATLGLFLLEQLGEPYILAGRTLGIATLTGLGLGGTTLIAMGSAPVISALSDQVKNRWRVVFGALIPAVLGFGLLSLGAPLAIAAGLAMAAVTSGGSTGLATILVGELGIRGQHGRRLGALFTVGDLASATGPLLAYAVMPAIGLRGVYLLAMALYALMVLITIPFARRKIPARVRLRTL